MLLLSPLFILLLTMMLLLSPLFILLLALVLLLMVVLGKFVVCATAVLGEGLVRCESDIELELRGLELGCCMCAVDTCICC